MLKNIDTRKRQGGVLSIDNGAMAKQVGRNESQRIYWHTQRREVYSISIVAQRAKQVGIVWTFTMEGGFDALVTIFGLNRVKHGRGFWEPKPWLKWKFLVCLILHTNKHWKMLLIDLGIVWTFIMEGVFDALVTTFWLNRVKHGKGILTATTKIKMKVSLFTWF